MLERIEREIERCERLMWDGDASPDQLRDLQERLVTARKRLDRLRGEPSEDVAHGISSELAHWVGNRDPLPEPHRLAATPFGICGRRN